MTDTEKSPYRDDCPACLVKRLWFEDLKFCGCGSQGAVIGRIRDVLVIMEDRRKKDDAAGGNDDAWSEQWRRLDALWGDNDAFKYLTYYVMDAAGIMEHGSSVPGWPTPYGEQLAEAMRGKTDDELDEMLQHDEYQHEST